MKPSPPKSPAPNRLVNAIPTSTPSVAHRKESRWQSQLGVPVRSSCLILPG